jgi:hypothetical protein
MHPDAVSNGDGSQTCDPHATSLDTDEPSPQLNGWPGRRKDKLTEVENS